MSCKKASQAAGGSASRIASRVASAAASARFRAAASATISATVSTLLSAGIANLVAAFVLVAALVLGPPASATPYWYAWEGDDWPENQGWTRFHGPNGAQATRTLANGQLTIDGIKSPPVYDFSRILGAGNFDPAPGEVFIMRWRMRVDQVAGPYPWDPGVVIYSDQRRGISFVYSETAVRAPMEFLVAGITPGVFHSYEVRTTNMLQYAFWIDGVLAWEGMSFQSVGEPYVAWGDGSSGSGSRSTWDYFRFGVVPEPTCASVVFGLAFARSLWSRVSNRG